jgi:flagellar basal-body rod modification protein FlgD
MAISVDQAQALARTDAATSSTSKSTANDLGDRFLKLLVTQMRNQDPLNPMENAEVTTQLAQISTVTGVDKLNSTIEAMSQSMASAQTYQAANIVGHGVLVPGSKIALSSAGAIGAVDLKEAASAVNIKVFDKNNILVDTFGLTNGAPAGVTEFIWDGLAGKDDKRAENGVYTFEIDAVSNGKRVESSRMTVTKVDSVTLGGSEVVLNTQTMGSMLMSNIKQIF